MHKSAQLYICILVCLLYTQAAFGQETKLDGRMMENDIIEGAVERADNSDLNIDTYQENLSYLLRNKINLNKAAYGDLRNSTLFTEVQIRDLQRHIEAYGPLRDLYELQTIPSFSLDDIRRLLPFITLVGDKSSDVDLGTQLYTGDYQLFTRFSRYLETQEGYLDDSTGVSAYAGNNMRVYTRFRYNYQNRLSYGFTAEKDAGEAVFGPTQPYGFDYYSAHFFKKGYGTLRALALGDYELRIGQGLMMWSGFGFGKSVFPLSIRRAGPVLDSYTSNNENRFLRGAGVTLAYGKWQVTPFISYKSIDANVSLADTLEDEIVTFSAIDESGLHRTENELLRKDAIKEWIGGFDATWYGNQMQFGVAAIGYQYSAELSPELSPYEYFDFTGSRLMNVSVHYNYLWRNLLFFGETSFSDNGKGATLNGLIMPVDPKLDLALLYRYFSPGYQTLYAATFSEATLPQNERGMYAGFELKPVRAWKFSGYLDMYAHQWLMFQTDKPSTGTDVLMQLQWSPSRAFSTYLRYKTENSDRNASDYIYLDTPDDEIPPVNEVVRLGKSSIRWHADYDVSKSLTVKTRIEMSLFDEPGASGERGYLVFQDFNYRPISKPYGFATRFAVFNTESFDTRIFAYETEVLYAYSIIGLSGRGTRAYLMFTYSPFDWLDIWARVANTWYSEDEPVGSGNDAFPGFTRSDAKLQMRIKW